MARPNTGTPGKLPEFLTSPSLGAWFAARLADMLEAEKAEAHEGGTTRARRVELNNLERAVSQIEAYHAADAA